MTTNTATLVDPNWIADHIASGTPAPPRPATVPWVETELAVHLNRLAQAVVKATAERDQAIAMARAAGHSLREIGLATGINHTVVLRILRDLERGQDGST